MRIAHVIAYLSEDAAFGGPSAVAIAQTQELAARGHEVALLAGWDGKAQVAVPGVRVLLFPVKRLTRNLSGLVSPRLALYLFRNLNVFDVVHVHMGRDMVTATAAHIATRRLGRLVVQTHGMVMPDPRLKSRLLDRLSIRRILERSSSVLTLTDREGAGVRAVARGRATVAKISNGVPAPGSDGTVVKSFPRQVVFLARLHPRKRVMIFAEMARQLSGAHTDYTFCVVGPDEGDLPALLAFIADNELDGRLRYEGFLSPGGAAKRLEVATLYVLPSTGEVFPMTVLESMAAGTAVVISEDCAIATDLVRYNAASTFNGTAEDLTEVVSALLKNQDAVTRLEQNARHCLDDWLSIARIAEELETIYAAAITAGAGERDV